MKVPIWPFIFASSFSKVKKKNKQEEMQSMCTGKCDCMYVYEEVQSKTVTQCGPKMPF